MTQLRAQSATNHEPSKNSGIRLPAHGRYFGPGIARRPPSVPPAQASDISGKSSPTPYGYQTNGLLAAPRLLEARACCG